VKEIMITLISLNAHDQLILYLLEVSFMILFVKVMVYSIQILLSWLVVSSQRSFIDSVLELSVFMSSFIVVIGWAFCKLHTENYKALH